MWYPKDSDGGEETSEVSCHVEPEVCSGVLWRAKREDRERPVELSTWAASVPIWLIPDSCWRLGLIGWFHI